MTIIYILLGISVVTNVILVGTIIWNHWLHTAQMHAQNVVNERLRKHFEVPPHKIADEKLYYKMFDGMKQWAQENIWEADGSTTEKPIYRTRATIAKDNYDVDPEAEERRKHDNLDPNIINPNG